MSEELWTRFNGRKFAAERAMNDRYGNPIVPANDSTITIKMGGWAAGATETDVGDFTTNQASAENITIPAAGSASGNVAATPGVMSSADKEKLDSIEVYTVEESNTNGNILVNGTDELDVYTHPTGVDQSNVGWNHIPSGGQSGDLLVWSANGAATWDTIDPATTSTDGLMSSTDKTKLDGITAGAEPNVQADWDEADNTSDAYIQNKPTIPAAANDAKLYVKLTATGTATEWFSADASTDSTQTIPAATTSAAGLMTDTDKTNLDFVTSVIPATGTHAASSSNQVVTQSEMAAAIADFGGFEVVTGTGADMHPDVQNPDTKIIYLVEDTSATGADVYKEWIYQSNAWTLIGDTTMSMVGYAKIPQSKTSGDIVVFTNTDELADSGTAISDLENVIESISVNGTTQTITSKNVDITVPVAGNTTPAMDSTGSAGSSSAFAREDHVHPSDTAKADKVTNATNGHLAGLDANGNLTDSGLASTGVITGVQLAGAQSPLSPVNGVVTIPNSVPTGTSGATNGLMTETQAQQLAQVVAWTWSSNTFDSTGPSGTETTSTFPFTVS